MKKCIICGNNIENDMSVCPICGAAQEPDLPVFGAGSAQQVLQPIRHVPEEPVYGGGKNSYNGNSNPFGGDFAPFAGNMRPDQGNPASSDGTATPSGSYPYSSGTGMVEGSLRPQFGTPDYIKNAQGKKDEISRRNGKILIGSVIGAAVFLLISVYFLMLVLTRNSFLNEEDKLREALPVYGYTINGAHYGELQLVSMTRRKTEGLYQFEVMYDVTMADDRFEHQMTMVVKGENEFPFGWKVTDATWSQKTQGTLSVKLDGLRPLVEEEVLKGIPTHQAENFAIWFRDGDSESPAFEGDCVIANSRDAFYTIQGSYSYEGMLAPSVEFDYGIYDYALTVIARQSAGSAGSADSVVSYGGNVQMLTSPVYVKDVGDLEYRLQITGLTGHGVSVEAVRIHKNGREPDWSHGQVDFSWSREPDPMTGNPIASDRVGGKVYLFSEVPCEIQVIVGPGNVEVLWNGESMQPRTDIPLEPEGWNRQFPDGIETTEG